MNDDMAYIGVKACGCAVGIVMDDAKHPSDVARTVSQFIADGYKVERVPRDHGVERLKRCAHK